MHRRWLSLPLLSSCVSAFYPYNPDNGGNENNKRFIPLDLEPQSKDDSGIITLDVKRVAKRTNAFPVVNSTAPNMPNAIAINQDGGDYTYFSTVRFGSNQEEMYMLIDSGSANTWVMGSNCKSNACLTHNTLGSQDSSTLKTTTQSWTMTYGTGEVNGVVAKDNIALANYTVNMSFGLATTASDDFNSYPMDGILGLGRAASDAINAPTIMQVLDTQGHLSSNILGIHLQRASDGTNDGQLTFGGVDSSKFAGKLLYSKTISDGSWQIAANDAGVDDKDLGLQGKTAIIDTGTSYILMPPADASALHALIPGSSQSGELFVVPCTSSANVYFTLSGVKYSVSPKDYVGKTYASGCQSNIIGHQAFGPNDWILGDVFLKNVYTVLDFDNARIGFGTKAGTQAANSSTVSSSAAASTTSVPVSSASSEAPSSSKPASTTSAASGASTPATTLATSQTKSSSTTSSHTSATATKSSGSGDSDPFSQGGNTGSSSPSASSSPSSGASDTKSTPLLPMMVAAVVVGFML